MPRGRIKDLSRPQLEALKEIRRFIDVNGYPPTIKELADKFHIQPPSMLDRLNQLIRKGYLKKKEKSSRSLQVVRYPEDMPGKLKAIPIVGTVAAGTPIMAAENITGEVLVTGSPGSDRRIFCPEGCRGEYDLRRNSGWRSDYCQTSATGRERRYCSCLIE